MPHVVFARTVIVSHIERIGRYARSIPVSIGLGQIMSVRVTQQIGESVPWPLSEGCLQGIVGAVILVRNLNDAREVRELAEVGPADVLAGRAYRRSRARSRAHGGRYGRGREGNAARSRLCCPAGAKSRRINIVEPHEIDAAAPHVRHLQRHVIGESVLQAEVPFTRIGPLEVRIDRQNSTGLIVGRYTERRIAA